MKIKAARRLILAELQGKVEGTNLLIEAIQLIVTFFADVLVHCLLNIDETRFAMNAEKSTEPANIK